MIKKEVNLAIEKADTIYAWVQILGIRKRAVRIDRERANKLVEGLPEDCEINAEWDDEVSLIIG